MHISGLGYQPGFKTHQSKPVHFASGSYQQVNKPRNLQEFESIYIGQKDSQQTRIDFNVTIKGTKQTGTLLSITNINGSKVKSALLTGFEEVAFKQLHSQLDTFENWLRFKDELKFKTLMFEIVEKFIDGQHKKDNKEKFDYHDLREIVLSSNDALRTLGQSLDPKFRLAEPNKPVNW